MNKEIPDYKCFYCDRQLTLPFQRNYHGYFCDGRCYTNWLRIYYDLRRRLDLPRLMHKEIEKMAWHLITHNITEYTKEEAWLKAEQFYNFAKEKEQEETNDDGN